MWNPSWKWPKINLLFYQYNYHRSAILLPLVNASQWSLSHASLPLVTCCSYPWWPSSLYQWLGNQDIPQVLMWTECVLQTMCWSPNPQYDNTWKCGPLEGNYVLLRSWGWRPHDEISALIRRGQRTWSLSPPCGDTARRQLSFTSKKALTKNPTMWVPQS